MAACVCGAPILWCRRPDNDELIALDTHPSPAGEHRWRIVGLHAPFLVEPVTATAAVSAYQEHSVGCPRQ